MRRAYRLIAAAFMLLALLTACSREELQQIGLIGIEVTFEVEPEAARTGEPVRMEAAFTGVELDENANVQIVVIEDGNPVMLKHRYEGDNTFTAEYAFERPGEYDVDLHLYYEEIHIYKKKKVSVQ